MMGVKPPALQPTTTPPPPPKEGVKCVVSQVAKLYIWTWAAKTNPEASYYSPKTNNHLVNPHRTTQKETPLRKPFRPPEHKNETPTPEAIPPPF